MDKDYLVKNIENSYFYGIDFEKGTIVDFKRFDNEKKEILKAYNESERFDTFALIKALYIELFIFKSNLSKVTNNEEISSLYNEFRERNAVVFAIFTNDLMKKIGRSIDIEKSSKLFEVFDSVGDALIYIYRLCRNEFIEVSKESNHIDEKSFKKIILHEYLDLAKKNFEPRSDEYDLVFKQYQRMLQLINNSSLEEFVDIFKKAYFELLRDIENNSRKGNVK